MILSGQEDPTSMDDSESQKIEAFIGGVQSVNPEFAEIIKLVINLFAEESEELLLGTKYGGVVFIRSSELIGGIFPYKEHVSIEFSNGAAFIDPSSKLEGKGKKRRHLKIFMVGEMRSTTISSMKMTSGALLLFMANLTSIILPFTIRGSASAPWMFPHSSADNFCLHSRNHSIECSSGHLEKSTSALD